MKKLLLFGALFTVFTVSAQTLPYVVDPATKKRITYTVAQDASGKVTFSNGKIATVALSDVDYAKVYKHATIPVKPPVVVVPPVVTPPATVWVNVGTGSGNLTLDNQKNVNLKVKPGNYDYISIGYPVNVKIDMTGVTVNNSTQTAPHSIDIQDPKNLELYGFSMTNGYYRGMNIRGLVQTLHIHDASFTNIQNIVISTENDLPWDGTDATANMNITISKCKFTACGNIVGLRSGPNIETGKINGLIKNFKFTYNTVRESPNVGNVVWTGAAENYEIAYNDIDHVNYNYSTTLSPNAPNGPHNGVFAMQGNGSLHDNKVTRFQGNVIRAWGMTFGNKAKKDSVLIYNNVAYSSSKYSAFELQATPDIQDFISKYPAVANYTDARVSNNTAGHLNTVGDWEGQMVDVYYPGTGTLSYYNNLGFEMNKMSDNKNVPLSAGAEMINYNYGQTFIKNLNNKYFPTWQESVTDLTTFKSKISGVGASL